MYKKDYCNKESVFFNKYQVEYAFTVISLLF